MNALPLGLALLALATLAFGSAQAEACDILNLGDWQVGGGPATFYVSIHEEAVWIYEESNGEAGLQRGGCSPYLPDDCETCPWPPPLSHDTLVY